MQNWINECKKEITFSFSSIIKYILLLLLLMLIIVLLIKGLYLFFSTLILLKEYIVNKWKNIKLTLDYKKSNFNNKPDKPNFNYWSTFSKKKKERKKALTLKNKILEIQNNNTEISTSDIQTFADKRNWQEKIDVGNIPIFSTSDQLNNVKYEFQAYDNQDRKFKQIVVDINKGKENFFPDESQILFKEYVSVIKILTKNLTEVKKNLKKS